MRKIILQSIIQCWFIDKAPRLQDDMRLSSYQMVWPLFPVLFSPLMNGPSPKPSRSPPRPVPREEVSPQIPVSNAVWSIMILAASISEHDLVFVKICIHYNPFPFKKKKKKSAITSVTSFGWLTHKSIYLLPLRPQNDFHLRKQTLHLGYDNWWLYGSSLLPLHKLSTQHLKTRQRQGLRTVDWQPSENKRLPLTMSLCMVAFPSACSHQTFTPCCRFHRLCSLQHVPDPKTSSQTIPSLTVGAGGLILFLMNIAGQ